jgi:hypothetical protein
MPLSSNAPFNEFGNSMILRDIELIWLTINGSGSGSSGDGQTQDQTEGVTQEIANQGTTLAGATGPTGPAGPAGADGTIPLGPGGETMEIITITGCVDGVTKTIYVYGYVVP